MSERRGSSPGTVEKALDLLAHLEGQRSPCGVSELGRDLAMPKPSVHRLLASLASRGYVERTDDGRYRLGFRLVGLGLAVLAREPLVEAARPALDAAARAAGETYFLAALRDGAVVVLDKVEGTAMLRAAPRIGESAPLHATAVGKLYLALAPTRVAMPDAPLERFTPRTLTTAASLARACGEVTRRGWAESREEWLPGLSFVAAPVRVGGELLGAVAAAVPSTRFAGTAKQKILKVTLDAARSIGARLEGSSR